MSMVTRRQSKGAVKNRHYITNDGYYCKPHLDKTERKKRLYFRYTKLAKPKPRKDYINSVNHDFPDTRPVYVAISYPSYARNKDITTSMNSYFGTGATENEFYKSNVVHAVSKKQNIIEEIYGFIRIGKSRLARAKIYAYARKMQRNVWIFFDIDDLDDNIYYPLNAEWTEWINVYVTYSYSQTVTALMHLATRFDWVLEDEIKRETGKNSNKTKWNLENVIKIAAGKRGLNLVFLTPDEKYITQVSFYNRVIAVNEKRQRTFAFLSIPGESENELQALGPITVNAREDPAVSAAYEARSDEVKGRVQGAGGASTPTPRDTEASARVVVQAFRDLEETNDDLLGNNKEYYLKDKNTAFMEFVALYCDDIYSNPNVDMIVNRAYNAIKNGNGNNDHAETKQETKNSNDSLATESFNEKFTFDTVAAVESKYHGDDVTWWKMNIMQGISQDKIKESLALDCDQHTISDHVKVIERWLNTDAVGHAYEKWHKPFLEHRDGDLVDHVDCEGIKGKSFPDNVEWFKNGDVDIYSLKCHRTNRKQVVFPAEEIDPEYKLALKLIGERPDKRIRLFLEMYNRYDDGTTLKQIDIANYKGKSITINVKYRRKRSR